MFVVLRRWHFGCLKRHHSLLSKSAMGLKFAITGLLFQALLIILFSVLVDYSDHALPSHSRKGASGDVNVTTKTLPVNDVSVYYPSKIVCFTCNSCFIRLRIRSIPTSPGFILNVRNTRDILCDIFTVHAMSSKILVRCILRLVMQDACSYWGNSTSLRSCQLHSTFCWKDYWHKKEILSIMNSSRAEVRDCLPMLTYATKS